MLSSRRPAANVELCGIFSEVRPIDIDHIVPRSKADKNGTIRLNGRFIDIDDRENLQALCFTCNRASDETDFRRKNKLVRDRIPEIIEASGRKPEVKVLHDQALRTALYDKLVEEHVELSSTALCDNCSRSVISTLTCVTCNASWYPNDPAPNRASRLR